MIRKTIDKWVGGLASLIMALLVVDVLWQVASRYLLNNPSSYTDELAGYLLVWVGLLGAAYVCGQKEHLAIDLWLRSAAPRTRIRLELAIYGLTLLFAAVVMTVGGSWLVYTRFLLEVTSASLEINLGYVYGVLPLSGLLIIYYSVDNARGAWKKYREESKTNQIPQ